MRERFVNVGNARAEADQRKHVRAAVDERSPEALEKRQATPEDYGGSKDKFDARQIDEKAIDVQVDFEVITQHAAHRDQEQWGGKCDANPEAARHVA